MSKETLIKCDICNSLIKEYNHKSKQVRVIFTTEQTEGRGVKPYFTKETIDICKECDKKLENYNTYITAHGAMGHNTYKLVKISFRNYDEE
jgi:hypothetical protein